MQQHYDIPRSIQMQASAACASLSATLQLQSASPCRVQASNALPPAKHVYMRLRNSLQKDYATNKPSR